MKSNWSRRRRNKPELSGRENETTSVQFQLKKVNMQVEPKEVSQT